MHSILGLLSMFHEENMSFEKKIIADTLVKTSSVLSTLINDAMEIPTKNDGRFPLEMMPFRLHSMLKEASCLAKCLSVYKGFGFELDVRSSLPDQVIGDEKRTFQVILHMVGYLLNLYDGGGTVLFRVSLESGSEDKNDKMLVTWRPSKADEYVCIKFEIKIKEVNSQSYGSTAKHVRRHNSKEIKEALSFSLCKKLVQVSFHVTFYNFYRTINDFAPEITNRMWLTSCANEILLFISLHMALVLYPKEVQIILSISIS